MIVLHPNRTKVHAAAVLLVVGQDPHTLWCVACCLVTTA